MSETKPPRLPACARGTDHQIDCGDHYWVRLVTRRAMQAEGECLQNCLRHGHRLDHAGPDDLKDAALWSLRRAEDAVSIVLAQVDEYGRLEEFKGPYNNQVSGTGYRQLQALRDYLVMYGATLTFDEDDVLVGENGETYRADKAPKEVRDAAEARQRTEREERMRRYEEMRAAAQSAQESQRVITWEMPAQVGRTLSAIRNPIGPDLIQRTMRQIQAGSRTRVEGEPLVEVTRQRDDEGFWNVVMRDPARPNVEQEFQHVLFSTEGEPFDFSRASERRTFIRRFRNGDGTWRLLITSNVSLDSIVPRCIFPDEGETAPAPAPAEQVPAPQEYVIGPGRVMFRHADGSEVHADVEETVITHQDVAIARRYQSAMGALRDVFVEGWRPRVRQRPPYVQQLRNLWDLYRADPTPTPAPRPAPDLSTPRGRTEAAMQRRQAQLADRRWGQENLREQRRVRR